MGEAGNVVLVILQKLKFATELIVKVGLVLFPPSHRKNLKHTFIILYISTVVFNHGHCNLRGIGIVLVWPILVPPARQKLVPPTRPPSTEPVSLPSTPPPSALS